MTVSGHVTSVAAGSLTRYQRPQMILGHRVSGARDWTDRLEDSRAVINHTF